MIAEIKYIDRSVGLAEVVSLDPQTIPRGNHLALAGLANPEEHEPEVGDLYYVRDMRHEPYGELELGDLATPEALAGGRSVRRYDPDGPRTEVTIDIATGAVRSVWRPEA